jgi:hypothetical protein
MTENCKLRRAILSAFYNISQRNFGILLILWCSFKLWWNFCLDQNLVCNANGPFTQFYLFIQEFVQLVVPDFVCMVVAQILISSSPKTLLFSHIYYSKQIIFVFNYPPVYIYKYNELSWLERVRRIVLALLHGHR